MKWCPVLLQLTLTPGRVGSADGPARDETQVCWLEEGHGGPHEFDSPPEV